MKSNFTPLVGSVLIVGGGISGVQASLDLSSLGFKVYLVEKSPMIGGKMAQLDKTFPTCDCSMCILSPKLIECQRNPNIVIMANTTIKSFEGEAGNFSVKLNRKASYVNENLCVGCGLCTSYCPAMMPDPFNENFSNNKAISLFCPQSVPLVASINPDYCLFIKEKKCKICFPVCKQEAIDFNQVEREMTINVGAAILTTGADIFDATMATEYGYAKMENVVNSMEFERLLNAAGPYQGEILRPSDGNIPKKIAWIQCVGSRDKRFGNTYCSAVCCAYAIKQVVLMKEHYPETEATIFYMDIRAFGKGFEEFYNRARNMIGVRFIQSRISNIIENKKNNNIVLRYFEEIESRIIKEEFEMVVLSVGLTPKKDGKLLAQTIGLELNKHGFIKTDEFSPNEIVSQPGVYSAGTATGPMDIPDAIGSGTGAVSIASQMLSSSRGALSQSRHFPEERPVAGEEPRIGVFVCHCGANIGRVVNVPAVVAYAATLSNVVHAEENLFSCSADAGTQLSETIRKKRLNRVVVAACTPRTHEPLFQDTLREAGINKYLFEMANIREHCSWVHSRDKDRATEKAKDLVSMAVARVAELVPLKEIELSINRKGLVLGGGLAGMKAALSLAKQGFEVYLVEMENSLGRNLKNIHYTLSGKQIQPFLERLKREIENEKNIVVFKGYELKSLSGSIGNFTSTIEKVVSRGKTNSEISKTIVLEHGIIIVATGGKTLKPLGYHYGQSKRVVTQLEVENLIISEPSINKLQLVAIIQCVGSRNEERPYCSRICCGQAIKTALKLKELNENMEIVIFNRDIRTYGFMEDYYVKALDEGIKFIRFKQERKPEILIRNEKLILRYYDQVLNLEGEFNPDLVVLSTAIIPNQNKKLAQILKVPLTADGFFMEAHLKLRPLDFANEGIFLCGMAHYPKNIPETISQAEGAAARAATILSQNRIISSGAVCEVNEDICIGCGLCQKICPYDAIRVNETSNSTKTEIISTVCKGCGACCAACPTGAITNHHFSDHQLLSQINAAYSVPVKKDEQKILAFLCNWCGYAGADLAGVSRMQYATNIRVIRVMCSARVNSKFIIEAFLTNIDGVLLAGCHMEDCHYIDGIIQTDKMIRKTKNTLKKAGVDPERLRLEHISAGEGAKYAESINSFASEMKKMGTLELTDEQREKLLKVKMKNSSRRKGVKIHNITNN